MKMEKRVTLYHAGSRPGTWKQWSIWKIGPEVFVEWGLFGKKLQTTSTVAKSKGKVGSTAFKDPVESAGIEYDKQIKKKMDEGYLAKGEERVVSDLFMGLTKNFVTSKPRNDLDFDALKKLDDAGKLVIQRKRDGTRLHVLITQTGEVKIYSRRIDSLTDHLPKLCQRIRDLKLLPSTILDGELVATNAEGYDDLRSVGTITRSKAKQAAEREAAMPGLQFMVFDVLFHNAEPVWEQSYTERRKVLKKIVPKSGTVFLSPELKGSLSECFAQAKSEKWEGIVAWLKDDATYVRDGGKPKRCGCVKLKLKQDHDVIATGYELGSGDKSDLVGAVYIAQYWEDGKLHDCGKCGSGFTMESAKAALNWHYPVVIKIECDFQEPDSGAFRFPVFKGIHDDKVPAETFRQGHEEE